MSTGEKHNGLRVPFMAFTTDSESAATLKQFAANHQWSEEIIQRGDVSAAIEFLKSHASPHVLCVDIPSAESAPELLNGLADVCDPTIKVIVSGTTNEYSFFCWLTEVGISGYLLKPFTLSALESSYNKASEIPAEIAPTQETKKEAKVIAIVGTRGGAGATTISVNMAWLLAKKLRQKTALLDLDPQLGTVALALDLEPGKGMRDALEKPERIDGLFLDRVMVKIDDMFSILSTEESLEDNIQPTLESAEALIRQIKPKFSYVIIDLPRTLSPFTRYALTHADHIICVTECSISGLRESLRYLEYCRDALKLPVPLFVGNRMGLAGKHQMPKEEFEKGLGQKITYTIPFALDAYAAAIAGEVLSEKHSSASAAKALLALTEHFVPELAEKNKKKRGKKFSWFRGGNK